MGVETRLLSILLIEKLKNDPEFARMSGIHYSETDKKQLDITRLHQEEKYMDNQTIGVEY